MVADGRLWACLPCSSPQIKLLVELCAATNKSAMRGNVGNDYDYFYFPLDMEPLVAAWEDETLRIMLINAADTMRHMKASAADILSALLWEVSPCK